MLHAVRDAAATLSRQCLLAKESGERVLGGNSSGGFLGRSLLGGNLQATVRSTLYSNNRLFLGLFNVHGIIFELPRVLASSGKGILAGVELLAAQKVGQFNRVGSVGVVVVGLGHKGLGSRKGHEEGKDKRGDAGRDHD